MGFKLSAPRIKMLIPVIRLIHKYPRLLLMCSSIDILIGHTADFIRRIKSNENNIAFWSTFEMRKGRPIRTISCQLPSIAFDADVDTMQT